MKRSTGIWILVITLISLLAYSQYVSRHMGQVYVQQVELNEIHAQPRMSVTGEAHLSASRTFGLWISALFTLAIVSFLYRDNPLYKVSESILIGVSAAYWMVVSFWTVIVPVLFARIAPDLVSRWAMPGTIAHVEWIYGIPLILGIMLLARLSPKGNWIARWPLALIVGTTAGMKMIAYLKSDFLSQISNTLLPFFVYKDPASPTLEMNVPASIFNVLIVVGVISGLVYFFFSFEHKGVVGQVSRVGIWFLMITFGAAFGYAVMGRITLLAQRIEFLVDDWMWLIDPVGKRIGM